MLCRLQKTRPLVVGIVLLIVVFSLAQPMHAQLFRGSISGTVTDQTNAIIVGAQAKLTNQATEISQTQMSNELGLYKFVALDPGKYTIEFSQAGFQSKTVKNIEIRTSEERTINPGLSVSGLNTTFDVHDIPGAELSKTNASILFDLTATNLDETPMGTSSLVPGGSRNFARYALWGPAVARVFGQNEFSTNGHRGRENNFMMDGVENNDNSISLPAMFTPPEALQAFQTQVAAFTADFGRSMGAQVNVITRSGGNDFHGELWEFYRGSALEPLSLQSRKALLTKTPRLADNQFGADVGGPIIKGKTFFFALVQGNRQRQAPKPFGAITIPTQAGYAALLTAPLRPAGGTVTAQDQTSRQFMLDALSFLPSVYATSPAFSTTSIPSPALVNGTPIELGTYNPLVPQNQNLWYGVVRVDHQLTVNDRLSYRVHFDHRVSPLSTDNLAFGDRWGADAKYLAQNHALSWTRTMSPNWVNEMRLSYARLDPSFVERDPVSPTVTLTSLFTIGGLSNFPQQRLEQTYQVQNVSTLTRGKHSLKFGVDLNRTGLFFDAAQNSKGTWTFPSLQSFMNNQAGSLLQLVSQASLFSFRQLKQAYFFQDDFKIARTFTVNLGMRYETTAIPFGYYGATDPTVQAAGVPGPVKRDTNNWGPRVGFAYSPTYSNGIFGKMLGGSRTSIRGGFGVSYDVIFYNLLTFPVTNYPRNNSQTTNNLIDVFPNLTPKTAVPVFSAGATFLNIPSDAQNPTTNYWSLSIQRQVKTNFIVEIGYTGNRSYHLIRQSQTNPGIMTQAKADAVIAGCTSGTLGSCQDPAGFASSPSRLDPTIGPRTTLETTGEASYNAGYIRVDKKASYGLQFGASYTYSANLSNSEEFANDTGSSDGGIATSSPQLPQNFLDMRREWSRSVFDRPHRLSFHEAYAIPFFSGTPKALKYAFSGWQISGFTEIQSGQPFTITVGVDTLGSGTATPGRPNLNPGGILIMDPATRNLRTFTIPLDGTGIVTAPHVTDPVFGTITFLKNSMPTGGTLGRNTFRGPGYSNTNISLMKRFNLIGERTLEIRGDFMNVFNHDNFPNPVAKMSDPKFGTQAFVPLTDARQVLVGAKIRF